MELTEKIIESTLYEGRSRMGKGGRKRWSQHVLWDDRLPGLGLRITPTNRKNFIVSYRAGGRKRTKTLGSAAKLSLEEARRQAAELLAEHAGESPAAAAPRIEGVETVADLADAYLEQHLKANVPSWYTDQRLMRTHIKPAMGRSAVAEVTQTDLANLRARVGRRFPADARRLKSLLAGMFDWAAENGLWSKRPRRAGPTVARPAPAAGPEAPPPADAEAESQAGAEAEAEPPPPPSVEELMESLHRVQAERDETAASLEEVSASGAEMVVKLNEQAAAQEQLETELRDARRRLERAEAEMEQRFTAEAVEKRLANLQQSVEQLMGALSQAEAERQELVDRLEASEARSRSQTRRAAGLATARNELENRLLEEQRRAAVRGAAARGRSWRRIGAWLALGLGAGIALTLLVDRGLAPAGRPPVVAAAGGGKAGRAVPGAAAGELAPVAEEPPGQAGPEAPAPTAAEPVAEPPAPGSREAPDAEATGDGRTAEPGAEPPARSAADPAAADARPGGAGDLAAAEAAVRAWAAAWAAQRVDDYLAAYSQRFEPPGDLGRGEWESQRRKRLLRPASIQVDLDELRTTALTSDRVAVVFAQSYRTESYADEVRKTLELVREEGGWKIASERAE